MTRINSRNERIKRDYRNYLRQANGKSDATIRQIDKALARFEEFTGAKDFATFDQRQAVRFKEALAGQDLAKATIHSTVNALQRFFGWLALQPGYKSRIRRTDIDYLALSDRDVRTAKAPADRPFPTLDQVQRAITLMPTKTPVERRNRALIALLALTGIRDGALITLKLKHIDIERRKVLQNPNEVATKRGKRIDTYFPPIDDTIEGIVCDWVRWLESELLFGPDDPLFSAPLMEQDADNCFIAINLSREHWRNAQPVRNVVKDAFAAAGLPYFPPHRFRHMLTEQAYRFCKTPEQMKAWSQNFGHEDLMTTLSSYGKIDVIRQGELIRNMGMPPAEEDMLDAIRAIVARKSH